MDTFYTKTEASDDYTMPSQPESHGTPDPTTLMTTQLHRSRNEGVVPDFIQKLFNMLESTDETSCYHWGRQGTTFVIDDTNEFSKAVLPSRFKHGNFSSFVRQLNKYDFHKIRFSDNKSTSSSTQQAWEFQHPLFRRDRKHQLGQIHRKVNNSRSHQLKQRQLALATNTRPMESADDDNNNNNNNNSSSNNVSTADMDRFHTSLQAQIDRLSTTQQSMESTMTRLLATDNLLLEELHGLKRKLDEKDSLISALLEQPKHHRSVYSAQQQHPLHMSSPMLSPQSPSLKLYPWLNPTSSSSSLASTTTQQQTLAPAPPLIHAPPLDPTSSSTPLPRIKSEMDGSSPYNPASSIPAPSLPAIPLITLPAIHTSSSPASSPQQQPSQPLTLTSSPSSSSSSSSSSPSSANNHRPPPLEEKPPAGTTCHTWRHRPKVLVVEDNVMYRRISMRCLQRLGCDFDLACDGLEAVACMKTSKYDLILMDISIPKLDGMAATRKLRQYDQHTPVVSMTANYSDHDIENYVGSGMSDLLPKPFDQYKLYDILKQHCAHLV